MWSLECISAQALCQSHPLLWARRVLQMGLISDLQRQTHPTTLNPGLLSKKLVSHPQSVFCKIHGIDNMLKTNS